MKNNFWLYSSNAQQRHTSGSLIGFGAQVGIRAKVIQDLDTLREYNDSLQSQQPYDQIAIARDFGLDYLVDCVRILIFFENYMKAELIIRDFCVHLIDRSRANRPAITALAKQQAKRPITLGEVIAVSPFLMYEPANWCTNIILKETTIGLGVLLLPAYRQYYLFDDHIWNTVKQLNILRNKLHFNTGAEFQLSTSFIQQIESINQFIRTTVKRLVPYIKN
jgi:hypothetical protein